MVKKSVVVSEKGMSMVDVTCETPKRPRSVRAIKRIRATD